MHLNDVEKIYINNTMIKRKKKKKNKQKQNTTNINVEPHDMVRFHLPLHLQMLEEYNLHKPQHHCNK